MKLESFEVDTSAYEDGRLIPLGEGAHVRVRAAGSERATKVRERLWKPYSTFREVPKDILDKLNAQWIAEGLLSEMAGFTVDGQPLDLDLSTKEDQVRLAGIIVAPKYRAFRQRIIGISVEETNYQNAADEALEKNSETSPASGSSGAKKPKE